MPNTRMMYQLKQSEDKNIIYIYDDITAHGAFNWETWQYDDSETSAKHFIELLNKVPDDSTLELHINSYGGEVKEGVAIYNMLRQKKCNKVCYVDGFAYSVASVICMACDRIIMGLGTSMLIHNMWMSATGNAEQLRKMADDLDVLMDSNRKIYLSRAKNITENELIDMMNAETYLTPDQCLEYGFCDEISKEYSVDENNINQCNAQRILQLQREINSQKSLKQSMQQFVMDNKGDISLSMTESQKSKDSKDEKDKNITEKQLKPVESKALHLMSAFFNAMIKEK